MLEVDALPERSPLAWAVEADDGETQLGQREEERVELLDEGIVAAVKDEGAALLSLPRQAESRQMSAWVRNLDALVSGDTLHAERPVAGEIVV